jgi:hypothetical protein
MMGLKTELSQTFPSLSTTLLRNCVWEVRVLSSSISIASPSLLYFMAIGVELPDMNFATLA